MEIWDMPPVGSRAQPLLGLVASPPPPRKLTTLLCENMLLCDGFKNDI